MVIELNKNNFDKEVFKSNGITLVDFWSPWCGFCQKQLPIVNELNENLEGKIKVGTVNLDESPEIAKTYNIASIPTFILFKDGKIKNKLKEYLIFIISTYESVLKQTSFWQENIQKYKEKLLFEIRKLLVNISNERFIEVMKELISKDARLERLK